MSVRRKPSLLWRIFVIVGMGSLLALSVNDDIWEQFESTVGDTVPRTRIQAIVAATFGLHVLEAMLVWRSARRNGDAGPFRWALATLVWGFPVGRRLKKSRKAQALAVEAVAMADEATALAAA
ncbi:MAG: DUF4499 domain-containing protein [Actinobacteria bacterium]|nr:DUF4499 domain-containing protein [Actinomycetota bacterium]